MVNQGYFLFSIVKKFTFKLLWHGSCFALMFVAPFMFEIMCAQMEIIDKIQRDELIAQASDINGFSPMGQDQPIVRPF